MDYSMPSDPRLITMIVYPEQEKKKRKDTTLHLMDEVRKLVVAIDPRDQQRECNNTTV